MGATLSSGNSTLAAFCEGGGKWAGNGQVFLEQGSNIMTHDCVPCVVDSLDLQCPKCDDEDGVGLEVSAGVAWLLVIILVIAYIKLWRECSSIKLFQ